MYTGMSCFSTVIFATLLVTFFGLMITAQPASTNIPNIHISNRDPLNKGYLIFII